MEKYKIVMLGEKDHGKSTLLANLLIASKSVSHERINEVKNISKKNKTRFEPAYILDAFSEERDLGMTIDTTRANIAYKNKLIELIDVPGHLELIKNMMTGASSSEIAVLVVSAKKNEGFKLETKRHLFLASMFNLKTVIIAVNKMDELDYNEKIFNRLKKQINDFLNMLDIKIKPIFIPISAYDNENLTVKSQKIKWYNGKSLLETITGLKNNKKGNGKNKNKIRVLIQDTFDENNKSFSGIIYSGKLIKNSKIKILPKYSSIISLV
ncbi:GTP-binding protein, partial [Candidatus Marsarchaeota archaeon]|nr:GTP-binding protein [Candidatus Marsarchaeota archaeon]